MPSIYLTVNEYNKERGILPWRYIGSDQNDNSEYLGSSKALKKDIEALGSEKFTKTIIESFDSMPNKDIRFKEAEHLSKNNVKRDPTYYNLTDKYAPGGGKKGMKHTKRRVIEQGLKRAKWTSESRAARCGTGNPMFGKNVADSTKEIWKDQRSGDKNSNALEWEIQFPDGSIIMVKGLRKFCRDNNFKFGKFYGNTEPGFNVTKFGHGKGGGRKSNVTM